MKIGIYPGCSLTGSAREYNQSVLSLAQAFGIEMEQVPDWNCCGATAAHNLNKDLSLALPARILASAENCGMTEIVIPCAACYSRLMTTKHELDHNPVCRNRISEIIETDYQGKVQLLNVIEFIDKYIAPKLEEKIIRKFNNKVACYYGCLLVRPAKILKYDRAENPQSMDIVMAKLGANPIQWNRKVECCGAGLTMAKVDIVAKLSGTIVEDAQHMGADAIIVACPMCHANLDMRRKSINSIMGRKFDIPVIYITQAIGWAMGMDDKKLEFFRHFVPVNLPEGIPFEKQAEIPVDIPVSEEAE
jgi:heterodisulfide reductase subunit B2